MYLRRQPDSSGDVAIIHTHDVRPFWPTGRAVLDHQELTAIRLQLIFFPSGEILPDKVISITVETPRGTIERWAQYLAPPVTGPLPPFSPTDSELTAADQGAALSVRSRSHETCLLVNTRHLSHDTIRRAIGTWLSRESPEYQVLWGLSIPEELANQMYFHAQLTEGSLSSSSEETRRRYRARADSLWLDSILIPHSKALGERLVEVPKDERLALEANEEMLSPMAPGERRRDPNPQGLAPFLLHQGDPMWLPDIRDISALSDIEVRYPALRVRAAIDWLSRNAI